MGTLPRLRSLARKEMTKIEFMGRIGLAALTALIIEPVLRPFSVTQPFKNFGRSSSNIGAYSYTAVQRGTR